MTEGLDYHDPKWRLEDCKPLPSKEVAHVELWFHGYSLCIVNDIRKWYHTATGKRIVPQDFIDTLEAELIIQERGERLCCRCKRPFLPMTDDPAEACGMCD